jgi:septum formation protein
MPTLIRLVLASASPARLSTLRQAGLHPEVVVSDVDETQLTGLPPAELAARLAALKAESVAERLNRPAEGDVAVVVGCDSVLELDGHGYGKPQTADLATQRWKLMRGQVGVLHTGHHLIVLRGDAVDSLNRLGSTTVHFADVSDDEIAAYVDTEEPLLVAGAFTVDGLGGPFVERIEGDYHNVVGISLPLLRTMLIELGVPWPRLWT